jgi:hypothetical protein
VPLAICCMALVLLVGLLVTAGQDEGPPPAVPAAPAGFVARDGMRLTVDGRPFRFVGFNSYVLFGCGYPQENIDGADHEEFFASLPPGRVVRLFLLPGTDLADFGRVVSSAQRHGQRLVVVLSDHYGDCGDTRKDDAFYRDGFRGAYVDWVRTVVPAYRDEPTIAMWELANEPRTSDTTTLRAFFDEAGGLVHELAPHHLVSSGTLQPDRLGGPAAFTELSASPGIDVVSLHEYDAVAGVSPQLWPALDSARTVGKPLFVGEWGLYAGLPGAAPPDDGTRCFSVAERAELGRVKLEAYLRVPEVAGALYWSYMAEGAGPGADTCTLTTTASDPLTAVIREAPIPLPG